ncbi:hypothetical protein HFP51_12670 [Parasphingopyxis sp. CP4]|uniref:hypothetical protein n=1 Tax=Parasphingopyxis sp. CP4 TaxID=2724527 RepID=UPI0015A43F88|nr:hypothetical protein [Parasphingopyxis sp. CP4]QLC22963.1 hypothetical protein HFP51_12670 [Parasphingopyxis sp. CP4]
MRFHSLSVALLTLSLAFVGGTAHAQSEEAQAAIERLAPLVGTSRVTGVRHGPNGATDLAASEAEGRIILGGHILREDTQIEQQPGDLITLQTQFSFDQFRNLYRIAVVDDDFGLMDIYEGRFISDTLLVATNLRSDTHFPLEDGRAMHFQLRWDFSELVVHFDVLLTVDGGANWRPFFELEYAHGGSAE